MSWKLWSAAFRSSLSGNPTTEYVEDAASAQGMRRKDAVPVTLQPGSQSDRDGLLQAEITPRGACHPQPVELAQMPIDGQALVFRGDLFAQPRTALGAAQVGMRAGWDGVAMKDRRGYPGPDRNRRGRFPGARWRESMVLRPRRSASMSLFHGTQPLQVEFGSEHDMSDPAKSDLGCAVTPDHPRSLRIRAHSALSLAEPPALRCRLMRAMTARMCSAWS